MCKIPALEAISYFLAYGFSVGDVEYSINK